MVDFWSDRSARLWVNSESDCNLAETNPPPLRIVTGAGRHSHNSSPILLPAVIKCELPRTRPSHELTCPV